MQAIAFYLALPFIYLVSALPFPLLYLLSDLSYFILYYVIGYRKKVVLQNLKNSFPEKTEDEILALQKKFFRYFCDLFLETLKTFSISKRSMLKHCSMEEGSLHLMKKLFEEKKSVILVLGHQGNWEWGGHSFSLLCKHPLYVIYHPLENKYFDRLVIRMRTRFGTKLIEMKNTYRDRVKMKHETNATAFIADQTPSPENAYWTKFMNQDTPVFKGTEVIARKLNYPVVFVSVEKIKRGRYQLRAEILCANPSAAADGEISDLHTKKLEAEICRNPENWLWSHRRWKHKR